MANIVVRSTTNSIKVDFGVYATALGVTKGCWRKERVRFNLSSAYVNAIVYDEPDFAVSFDGATGTFQIDSVDGAAPSSNSDLYDKLIALIA